MIDENLVMRDILSNNGLNEKQKLERIVWNIQNNMYKPDYFKDVAKKHTISSRDAREVVKFKLREELKDFEYMDCCGAPWLRMENHYVQEVYDNIDEWWNDDLDFTLNETLRKMNEYFNCREVRIYEYDNMDSSLPHVCLDVIFDEKETTVEEAMEIMKKFDKEYWLEKYKEIKRLNINIGIGWK